MIEKRGLFEFMLDRVKRTSIETGLDEPQAFGRWFLSLYFRNPQDIFVSDGSKDGKVDIFYTSHDGKTITNHILNAKFTHEYNKLASVKFYEEITYLWNAFDNKGGRET